MPQHIQQQVDLLILQQGNYTPLELLLAEGRLTYPDYESWRSGGIEFLAEELFGDPEQIKQQLQIAEQYAKDLGWQAESVIYYQWQADTDQKLSFSADFEFNRIFHHRYCKSEDQPQFDLFMDTPATRHANGVSFEIINRDCVAARNHLEKLYDTAPDHTQLADLEQLVQAAERLLEPINHMTEEMEALENNITPLAETYLKHESRNLVLPSWRRLDTALENTRYDKDQPKLHVSYTSKKALDWPRVRIAIEQTEHWQTIPELMLRHAEACGQQQMMQAALQSWFEICWNFPKLSDFMSSVAHPELQLCWDAFQDLDPELEVSFFPAWSLLKNPGWRHIVSMGDDSSEPAKVAFQLILQLQGLAQNTKHDRDNITLREKLNKADPTLFQYYLNYQ